MNIDISYKRVAADIREGLRGRGVPASVACVRSREQTYARRGEIRVTVNMDALDALFIPSDDVFRFMNTYVSGGFVRSGSTRRARNPGVYFLTYAYS